MTRWIVLDSQPTGLLVHPDRQGEIEQWVFERHSAGSTIALPAIIFYELRRELLRAGFARSLSRLDEFAEVLPVLEVSKRVLTVASELWAEARRAGRPTAEDRALDVDVILAATALDLVDGGHEVTVATTNVRHLSRFVAAAEWQSIGP